MVILVYFGSLTVYVNSGWVSMNYAHEMVKGLNPEED